MRDIRERLSVFDRLEMPDLWEEASRREPKTGRDAPPSTKARVVAALVALAVCVPAGWLAIRALSPEGQRAPGGTEGHGRAPAVFFPVERDRPNAYMEALLTSRITVSHGCVFAGPNRDTLLLWPYGSHLGERVAGQPLRVLSESGTLIAVEGLHVHMGGGYVSENPESTRIPERIVRQPIPQRCHPTYGYWLVGQADPVPSPTSESSVPPQNSQGVDPTPAPKPLPGPELHLFHGRTNDHFWNLSAFHRGREWELKMVSMNGDVLFDQTRRLNAAHPAVFGSVTWNDPGGPASIVFGLGRAGRAEGLQVRTTGGDQQGGNLSEDVHPPGLSGDIRFFLQDFGGEIVSIRPLDRAAMRAQP